MCYFLWQQSTEAQIWCSIFLKITSRFQEDYFCTRWPLCEIWFRTFAHWLQSTSSCKTTAWTVLSSGPPKIFVNVVRNECCPALGKLPSDLMLGFNIKWAKDKHHDVPQIFDFIESVVWIGLFVPYINWTLIIPACLSIKTRKDKCFTLCSSEIHALCTILKNSTISARYNIHECIA